MKEEIYDDLFEEKEEKTNWQATLFKYVIRWPWFIASIVLCMACAWLYLKTITPVYNINASIIIKDDKKGGNSGGDLSAFENLGFISSAKNIDNEIEILRSKSLIKDVVSELGLYISYSGESGFNRIDLYGSSPILVHFLPEDAERMSAPILLSISYHSDQQIDVTATIGENTVSKHFTKLPAVLSGEAGTLTFMSNPSVPPTGSGNIDVSIVNPLSVAKGYRGALSIEPTSKSTSVVTVSVKNTNKKRGEDFINKLIEIYNKKANNDKNEVAQNTARFIDERISNAPAQERRFVSIQRQQEIKAGLYLMLLQKREENNIALAATANNAKIIDDALADDFPVSPNSKSIYMIAFTLGLGIPAGIIYILNLLSFRIEGRADVEKLTAVPIIGDLPLTEPEAGHTHTIAVRENDNDIMAETFRSLRTNLLFILGDPDKKVILITSTMSGEGKTFIASNLAVSLALLGKKVIIVGLDIRKPGLNKVFHISHKEYGITQYLSAPQSTDLRSMIQPSGISPNLSVLPGGIIPPNPTELLARQSLEDAVEILKQDYDYIVLDTAPIGMVTDTQLIARVADASIYVCRADYTHKNDYQLINELYNNNRLPNLCTVINGLDMKKKKYGYYYGYGKYGKYYGYGKKYGYGYGYGYGSTSDRK